MNKELSETIYSGGDNYSFIAIVKSLFQSLPKAHSLGLRLAKRNIKAMYRQSLLGLFWALIPPIVTAGLWILLRSNNVMKMNDDGINYPVFVLTGTMLWQVFAESLQAPLKSMIQNKGMLIKINIPREGLLLSGVYEVLFNLMVKGVIIVPLLIYFEVYFSPLMVLSLFFVFGLVITGFAFGTLLVPIGMLYQDINRGLIVLLPFLMYLTPVVYPWPHGQGLIAKLMSYNPIAYLITDARDTLLGGEFIGLQESFYMICGSSLIGFMAVLIYKISMPVIIERIGS